MRAALALRLLLALAGPALGVLCFPPRAVVAGEVCERKCFKAETCPIVGSKCLSFDWCRNECRDDGADPKAKPPPSPLPGPDPDIKPPLPGPGTAI